MIEKSTFNSAIQQNSLAKFKNSIIPEKGKLDEVEEQEVNYQIYKVNFNNK